MGKLTVLAAVAALTLAQAAFAEPLSPASQTTTTSTKFKFGELAGNTGLLTAGGLMVVGAAIVANGSDSSSSSSSSTR